ncbi:MAG: hypothetical protein H6839_01285 [Planctomycetes bacterium]|nr:hypothetical protein [Planctomycetota bacterium]
MKSFLLRTSLIVLLFGVGLPLATAGCSTTKPKNLGHEGGEVYADVPAPANYEPFDTPPFKRQDGAGGKRVYGRYAYRSTNGLDSSKRVADWYKKALPDEGWELQTEEVDDAKGTMKLLFKKNEDQLELKLNPDDRLQGSERYSVLIVEMNPQYD